MKSMNFNKLVLFCVFTALAACSGGTLLEDRYSMEYLDAKTGKPIVYPKDIEQPEQSLEYAIPDLSPAAAGPYDINEVIKPPRLVPLPNEDDDEVEDGEGESD